MKYRVDQTWYVGALMLLPGTIVDDSQEPWTALRGIMPPFHAAPLDQQTYDWLVGLYRGRDPLVVIPPVPSEPQVEQTSAVQKSPKSK